MLDIYIKHLIIHQFSPNDTELILSDHLLTVTPKLDDYFKKKISKVFSEDAKRGVLPPEHPFLTYIKEDLLESSISIAQLWKEAFVFSEDQKNNELIFIEFEKNGQSFYAFLRIALKENLVHMANLENPITLTQNNFPSASQSPDDALIINKETGQYYLIEKRIKHDGAFSHYFSEQLLHVQPEQSVKKTIKIMENKAQKIAEEFQKDDFQFQSKLKNALFHHIEEDNLLSPEKLADQLFDDSLTARLKFVDELKETVPKPVSVSDIDHTKQTKKLETQKLSLSNGIELLVPNTLYQDSESVEFIQNQDGTYSILIKNIQDISHK